MASTHDGSITLNNGEAAVLPPWRRVKIHSTVTECVYADASDGDSWIGTTIPMEGGDTAVGAPQTIRLRGESRTLKIETDEAVEVGDAIYPENDGKCSDSAGTVVIGTALSASTASGGIIEMLPNAGSGAIADEESIGNADGTTKAGIPIALELRGITASGQTEIQKPARKLRIQYAFAVIRETTTNATVKLQQESTDMSLTSTLSTVDTVTIIDITDAVTEIASDSTLNLNLAATVTAPGVDVFVQCIPVS